jgi:uncharacterized sodium:solute symporter family permease YidK
MMNWLPQLDWRFSACLCAVCLALFAWAFIAHDLFGVMIGGISALTNFASAMFSYSIQPLIKRERRQHLISLTLGD